MAKTTIKLIIASIMMSVACIANAQSRKYRLGNSENEQIFDNCDREEKHLLNKIYMHQKNGTYTTENIRAATRMLEIKDRKIAILEIRIRELEAEIARCKWREEFEKRKQNNRLKYRDSRDYKTNIRLKMANQKRK